MHPLILTARLQDESQTYFNQLRQTHFPPERNFIPAHVTLFHALPPTNTELITAHLDEITRRESPITGRASELRNLGRGVAFLIDCPRLVSLRASLAQLWHRDLTPQDRHTPRLHITVQNKVSPDAARDLLATLRMNFQPRPLLFEGLDLWHYLGGPWSLLQAFSFQNQANNASPSSTR